jgi:hypothetical protein
MRMMKHRFSGKTGASVSDCDWAASSTNGY